MSVPQHRRALELRDLRRSVEIFVNSATCGGGGIVHQEDRIMFTRDWVPFCAVCRRAIAGVLDTYSRR